jgi:hypothetical protein
MIYQTVFDGVDPTIIHMRGEICVVPNMMLPKPALPNTFFASFDVALASCAA